MKYCKDCVLAFNLKFQVHLNGWAARAFWDEWELAGDMREWEKFLPHYKSIIIRCCYTVMFICSTTALGKVHFSHLSSDLYP